MLLILIKKLKMTPVSLKALVRDKSRAVSQMEGNDKLYGIICRKIIVEQLGELLQCVAASGSYDFAQKIANKHKDVLPQSFHLEDEGRPPTNWKKYHDIRIWFVLTGILLDSGPRNVTNIYTNKVEMKGHNNTFNTWLGVPGADSQNRESDASNECSYYELEDETDDPRSVH